MKVFQVIANFEYEPTPSYTVALFVEKAEADKFAAWCDKNAEKVHGMLSLGDSDNIKDFFVIEATVYKAAESAQKAIEEESK